jgi:hypothetical protein
MQEDVQRAEMATLRMKVETLRAQLAEAGEAIKAAEECRDVNVRALSEKESELARLATVFDESSMHEAVQKTEIVALRMQVEALQAQPAPGFEAIGFAISQRWPLVRFAPERISGALTVGHPAPVGSLNCTASHSSPQRLSAPLVAVRRFVKVWWLILASSRVALLGFR